MKKVLFTATVDSHILAFHLPYLKYFKDNGYEVHVATNGAEAIPYTDVKHIVPFERSPLKPGNIRAILSLKKIIEKEKFDIIHTHTPMGAAVTRIAAIGSRKRNKTRVIYTAHGFHFFTGAPLQNWLLFYPVEKLLARYTDTLITINKEDYERSRKKFKTEVRYVPGVGIDPEKFDSQMTESEKSGLRKSLGLKENDFVLIFPAELNRNKNQILLINAMEKLVEQYPDIQLLLPGKDSYNGRYQAIVQAKQLEHNVHFLGHRKDIPELLQITNLVVSSSLREGLPVNIMEACYTGLPIISTNSRGNRDIVRNNVNGFLVDPKDDKEFAERITELINDKELYKKFAKNNKIEAKKYLLDGILGNAIDIYQVLS